MSVENIYTVDEITRYHQWHHVTYRVGQNSPDHFLKCMTPVYDEVGRRSIYIRLLSSLSGVTLIFGMLPYLNILGISLEKRYCAENTN